MVLLAGVVFVVGVLLVLGAGVTLLAGVGLVGGVAVIAGMAILRARLVAHKMLATLVSIFIGFMVYTSRAILSEATITSQSIDYTLDHNRHRLTISDAS